MTQAQAQELINFLFFLKIIAGIWTFIFLACLPVGVVFVWQVVREYRKAQKERAEKLHEKVRGARNLGAFWI